MAQEVLTLPQARELVLKNNQQAKRALLERQIAEQNVKTARARRLPSVSASATTFGTTDHVGLAFLPRYGASGGLTLEQPVYLGGKLHAGIEKEEIAGKIAAYKMTLTNDDLLYKTEEYYWNIVAAGQQVKVAQEYEQSLGSLEEKVSNTYNQGLISRSELLEVKVAHNRASYSVRTAVNRLALSRLSLAVLLNLDTAVFEVTNNFPEPVITPEFTEDAVRAVNNRAELKLLDQALKGKDLQAKVIRADYKPEIGVSLSIQGLTSEEVSPGEDVQGPPLLTVENNQVFGMGLLSVSLPIFDFNRKKTRLKANNLQREQLLLDKQELTGNIRVQLLDAIYRWDEANLKLSLSRESVEQAEENLRITKNKHQAGRITSEEVLEAEALLQEARLEVITARVMQQLSYTNYLRTTGNLSK